MSTAELYQSVTDQMIAALKKGTAPWRMPFISGYPINVLHGRRYRGINVWLLTLTTMDKGYSDARWGTFKACKQAAVAQARREGRLIIEETIKKGRYTSTVYYEMVDGKKELFRGGVRKGETATHITFWKRWQPKRARTSADLDKNGKIKTRFLLWDYSVFNAEQCDGIAPPERFDHDPIEAAADLVREYVSTGPLMQSATGRAYYDRLEDLVNVPPMGDFKQVEAYYSTLYHELIHSTGHKDRLDRLESTGFGSGPYAKEELVAEMGAGFLCGIVEIDNLDQSAAYVANWLGALEDDPKFVVQAAGFAQKATDLILGVSYDKEEEPNGEVEAEAGTPALATT